MFFQKWLNCKTVQRSREARDEGDLARDEGDLARDEGDLVQDLCWLLIITNQF